MVSGFNGIPFLDALKFKMLTDDPEKVVEGIGTNVGAQTVDPPASPGRPLNINQIKGSRILADLFILPDPLLLLLHTPAVTP